MENLVFKNIWILSKTEKAGAALELKKGVNLLTGDNDVGKSTVIKSLYHCLGADTPKLNNSMWKNANPIYCVKIGFDGRDYYVLRDEKYFGVFDEKKSLISRYSGISGEGGIASFTNDLLGFDIELERHANSQLGRAGPAYYFLPFYVDQDEGWTASWTSFNSLKQFKNYRKHMIEFHLGVRPQSYYDAKKLELELGDKLTSIEKDRLSLQAARDSIRKKKKLVQVDLDPVAFRDEMEQAVDQYNVVYAEQQSVLSRLKEFRNQRNTIDIELDLLRRGISELEADYKYAESTDMPDHGNCPTCGTEFTNSFVERFGILDDIDHCHALVDQWLKKRVDVSDSLLKVEEEYAGVSRNLLELEGLLQRTKENVTLSELIASEGMKEMVNSLDSDISILLDSESTVHTEIEDNKANLKLDSQLKKKILEYYQARMKEFLNSLNVSVLSESDYDALDKQITNNALGSDRPRSLAAQYYAFLYTMKKFNTFKLCPMVIDSPFQQEQDQVNEEAIMNFLVSRRLDSQQLILATISVDDFAQNEEIANATKHELNSKYKLLQKDQYASVCSEIEEMHNLTLASDG